MSRTRSVVLAGGVGSAVEWFDFGVYGYLAPVIGARFFPSQDPVAAMLSGFAVFCVGYFMRPVGGLLLGRVGDRLGRRRMLMASVVAMGGASVLIGLLPTYDQVGVLAPVLLVLLRSVQGIAVGGEYTGAMAYTAECAPPHRRGLVSSMATFGVSIGLLGGSGAVALLHAAMTEAQVQAWGWRLPFLASVFVAAMGLWLRGRMPESDAFHAGEAAAQPRPFHEAMGQWRLMLRIIAVTAGANTAFYAGFVYMPDALGDLHPELAAGAQGVNSAMLALQALLVAMGGWLSDLLGRRRIAAGFGVLLLACLWPAWRLGANGSLQGLVLGQLMLSVPAAALFGLQGAMVSEMCPARIRCTVCGLGYSVGIAAFSGTVPVLATFMVGRLQWTDGPAVYLLAAATVSLVTLAFLRPSDLSGMDAQTR
jgi:MHS family proline/betaine transporter-like MFS transporter